MKEITYQGPSFFDKGKEKKALRSRGSEIAPTIRTFRADVEELIEEKGTTKTQMVMAETARREARGESRVQNDSKSHLGMIIFVLFLVLAFGIGVGAYVLIGTKTKIFTPPSEVTPEIIPLEQQPIEIQLSGAPREQIMADISINFGKTKLAVGGVREVHFILAPKGEPERRANTGEVLRALSISPPSDSLIRSLGEIPTYGIHVETNALAGYLLFTTRSYPNTFSGMLEWENAMANDLIPAINPSYPRKEIKNFEGKIFTDERIAAVDARTLRDDTGKLLLAYTFIDRAKLLITSGEETFAMILTREQAKSDTTIVP